MTRRRFSALAVALIGATGTNLHVAAQAVPPPREAKAWHPFADTICSQDARLGRFADGPYAFAYAGPGLLQADGEGVFNRMSDAMSNGDLFKALYLARLLTRIRADLDAAWTNRARIAETIGLKAEAKAAIHRREAHPILPGLQFRRPNSIRDWAAAVALMDDDVAAAEGPQALVAVQAGVSGYNVREDSVATTVRAAPIFVEDLLPNAFVLRSVDPMRQRSGSGVGLGVLIGAALAAVQGNALGSGSETTRLVLDAARVREERAAVEAAGRPSDLEGGMFVARLFRGAAIRNEIRRPRPTGGANAVDYPFVVPWASGGSLHPRVEGRIAVTNGASVNCTRLGKRVGEVGIPKSTLSLPKLLRLCVVDSGSGSKADERSCARAMPVATILELMLSPRDQRLLFPWLPTNPLVPDWAPLVEAYERRLLALESQVFAVDPAGAVFDVPMSEWTWVSPIVARGK